MSSVFIRSFKHALRGMRICFATERSFRLQVAIGLAVISLSLALPLVAWQRVIVWFVVMVVLVLELVNSSVERMVDLVKPRLSECAGDIKDIMAGAVLVASFFAVLIGLMIFLPFFVFVLRTV